MEYLLAVPYTEDTRETEILEEAASILKSKVVMKSKGQSRPVLAIPFSPIPDEDLHQLMEVLAHIDMPFNVRLVEDSTLQGVWLWRAGLPSPLYIDGPDCLAEARTPGLSYSNLAECSFEGVVLAGHERPGATSTKH